MEDRPRLWMLLSRIPVTVMLCAGVVLMFSVQLGMEGGLTDIEVLWRLGAMQVDRVSEHGEVWRLVTALFLHGGWLHLLLNLFALVQLAALVELIYGGPRMLAFYVVSGIVANLVSALLNPAWMAVGQVGASGALLGLAGVLLGLALFGVEAWRENLSAVVWPLSVGLSLTLSLGVVSWWMEAPFMVDNAAHFGGFCSGLLFAAVYRDPSVPPARVDVAMGASAAGLVVAAHTAMVLQGPDSLETLPAGVTAALEARVERMGEGQFKSAVVFQLVQYYAKLDIEDREGRVSEVIQGMEPETLGLLYYWLDDEGGQDDFALLVAETWASEWPSDPNGLNTLAWQLVTHEDVDRRDPLRARELAADALARIATDFEEEDTRDRARAAVLDTQAEALFQLGDLEAAQVSQQEAVTLGAEQDVSEIDEMRDRLRRIEEALQE